MTCLKKYLSGIAILLLSAWMSPAYGVAYCALRDPVKNIYTLFPQATSYQSIVHDIDSSTQQQVKDKVNFSIHKDELSQHTLYIAMNEEKPLGLVHSRSEVGLWGLIEIVWAFDFDLKVVDFKFQRCRERACRLIDNPEFRHLLKEKSATELTLMLDQDAIPYPANIASNADAKTLAKTIFRSAIKTALVTNISWHQEIQNFVNIKK